MELKEKIGLGLHVLEKYGFKKQVSSKVYYENYFPASKGGIQTGINIVREVKVVISIKKNYIEVNLTLTGISLSTPLGSYTYSYPCDMDIEKVLLDVSDKIKDLNIGIQ